MAMLIDGKAISMQIKDKKKKKGNTNQYFNYSTGYFNFLYRTANYV